MPSFKETPERPIKYHYIFKFFDGSSTSIEIFLDPETLHCAPPESDLPNWAKLSFNKCENCTLPPKGTDNEFCPVAANISNLDSFGNFSSNETAQVSVLTRQRDFSKSTTVAEGLTSILGLYMVTSGCPIMDKLKPLVRYHLPFSSLEENVFRVVSMYLLVQYFLDRKGRRPDWGMKKIQDIYEQIRIVNAGVARRLKGAARKDASLTAMANLDCLASLVPFVIDETLERIESSLRAYMEDSK
jgi:hypothetical protein